ncbi:MAG TPA: MerR family transcriptional regulator [Acidimicrobiales bacterium]|nr:MerR family transcriptional regulator [Acidimicrobiales bacterium]
MTARSHLSIGEVLSLLQEEFPDVTISKIRFLESQGLVDPERTPSGYRKFYEADIERLRWVLRQQRDAFLPLKVIKGRLEGQADLLEGSDGQPPPPPLSRYGDQTPGSNGTSAELKPGATPRAAGADDEWSAEGVRRQGPPSSKAPDDRDALWESEHTVPERQRASAGVMPAADLLDVTEPSASAGMILAPAPAAGGRHRAEPAHGSGGPGKPAPAAGDGPSRAGATQSQRREVTNAQGASQQGTNRGSSSAESPHLKAPHLGRPRLEPPGPGGAVGVGTGRPTADRPGPGREGPGREGPGREGPTRDRPNRERLDREGSDSRSAERSRRGSAGRIPKPVVDNDEELSLEELVAEAGVDPATVHDLERYGLVAARIVAGTSYYSREAVVIATVAGEYANHGVEARHLRAFKAAAEREAGLVQQVIMPLIRQRNPDARQAAAEAIEDLCHLGGQLRSVLLRAALSELR